MLSKKVTRDLEPKGHKRPKDGMSQRKGISDVVDRPEYSPLVEKGAVLVSLCCSAKHQDKHQLRGGKSVFQITLPGHSSWFGFKWVMNSNTNLKQKSWSMLLAGSLTDLANLFYIHEPPAQGTMVLLSHSN